jgi:tetratricopeptide (TPR) repeat protein
VRANEILSDEDQRAAYDHLLHLAHKEQSQQSTANAIHKVATSVIALSLAGAVGLGAYLVYENQNEPQFSGTLQHLADLAIARPGDFAGLAPSAQVRMLTAVATDAKAEPAPDVKMVQTIPVEPPATARTPSGSIMAVATAPQAVADNAPTPSVGPPLEIVPNDAKAFRERGIFAYRSGDLDGAVAEFDRAIQLDPKFSAAYIDRGIALYRLQKFERAFADIAEAKRIEKANRKAAQAAKKPKLPAAVALGFPPFFQHRTAKLE